VSGRLVEVPPHNWSCVLWPHAHTVPSVWTATLWVCPPPIAHIRGRSCRPLGPIRFLWFSPCSSSRRIGDAYGISGPRSRRSKVRRRGAGGPRLRPSERARLGERRADAPIARIGYRPRCGSAPRSAGLVKGGRSSVLIEQRMRGLGFSWVRCGSIMAVDGHSRTMASRPTLSVPSLAQVAQFAKNRSDF